MSTEVIRAPDRLEAAKSVGPQLFRLLRGRIVRGELVPGTRLSESDVALVYGTSRQPVREAFIKLAEASLIEVRPQRGSYVSRIDIAAVLAAQFVREAVEADIVRRVAVQATAAAIRDFEAMLADQVEAAGIDDPQPFISADEAFHRRLAEVAGQGGGWDVLQPLKTQMDRVRHLSARQFPRRALIEQHRAVIEAIRAGDGDGAEAKMRLHLRQILADVPTVATAHPNFFEGTLP